MTHATCSPVSSLYTAEIGTRMRSAPRAGPAISGNDSGRHAGQHRDDARRLHRDADLKCLCRRVRDLGDLFDAYRELRAQALC